MPSSSSAVGAERDGVSGSRGGNRGVTATLNGATHCSDRLLDSDLIGVRLGVEEGNGEVTVGPLDRLNRQQREVEEASHVGT